MSLAVKPGALYELRISWDEGTAEGLGLSGGVIEADLREYPASTEKYARLSSDDGSIIVDGDDIKLTIPAEVTDNMIPGTDVYFDLRFTSSDTEKIISPTIRVSVGERPVTYD